MAPGSASGKALEAGLSLRLAHDAILQVGDAQLQLRRPAERRMPFGAVNNSAGTNSSASAAAKPTTSNATTKSTGGKVVSSRNPATATKAVAQPKVATKENPSKPGW